MFYEPRFAIDAIACGKEGAISIHRFVQPHSSLTIGRDPNYFIELDKEDILVENYDNTGRQTAKYAKTKDGKLSFRDTKLTRDHPEATTMRRAEEKLKYILPNGIKQAIKRPFVKKTPKETAWL